VAKTNLTQGHASLDDALTARRYFAKFDAITTHMARVAGAMESAGKLSKADERFEKNVEKHDKKLYGG